MTVNGYGRIGRDVLRAHYEGGKKYAIQIVAIHDIGDLKTSAYSLSTKLLTVGFPRQLASMATAWSSTATASACWQSATPPSCPGPNSTSTW